MVWNDCSQHTWVIIFQSDKLSCSALRHMIHPIAWLRLKISMLEFAFFFQCKLNTIGWVFQRRLKKPMLIDGKNCAYYMSRPFVNTDVIYSFYFIFFLNWDVLLYKSAVIVFNVNKSDFMALRNSTSVSHMGSNFGNRNL